MRATMSLALPAAKGTIAEMVRFGQACAKAGWVAAAVVSSADTIAQTANCTRRVRPDAFNMSLSLFTRYAKQQPAPRVRCTPSPRRGEGRGEGVRTYRGTYSPSPHPSPQRGEGADRVRCVDIAQASTIEIFTAWRRARDRAPACPTSRVPKRYRPGFPRSTVA